MSRLIDDYLRELDSSLRADSSRKQQIVDELRTHLTEKVEDVQRGDPSRPLADIEQEVLREFGNPRDLALAYEPEGAPVLMNSAGDIVLRLGKAVGRGAVVAGRGAGKALKWVAVGLAALLIISLGVGAWAYYEVKPFIPAIIEQSEPTYQYFERCAQTPCNGTPTVDHFYVRPEAKTVRIDLNVYGIHANDWSEEHVGGGSLRVTVTDPVGGIRYDRTIDISSDARTSYETSWSSVPGNWSVAYTFEEFVGAVDVETYAIAFPWGEE